MTDSRRDLGDGVDALIFNNVLTFCMGDPRFPLLDLTEAQARALLAFLRECGWPKEEA